MHNIIVLKNEKTVLKNNRVKKAKKKCVICDILNVKNVEMIMS